MEFYSVKHKKSVQVPDTEVKKKELHIKGKGGNMMTRYAAVSETTVEGSKVKLTKFLSKDSFDALKVPVVS